MKSLAEELRGILIPERKWHYVFHFMVVLVAAFYWLGSLYRLPGASWAEIAMYRPSGDNQLYPAIAALSRLNLGDPTDALHYGEGTSGSQVVILLPYALAYAVLGTPGYMVADMLMAWLYFVAVTLLLRRGAFGSFSSLVVGAALASNSLQAFSNKLNQALANFLAFFKLDIWEWGVPNLLELPIFMERIPRPMLTAILVVLLLYFLLRQWQERRMPSFRRSLAMGALLSLLMQGDPFSVSALGLLLLWVTGWTVAANGWAGLGRLIGGGVLGAASLGWYFFWQQFSAHPDFAVRFGLADYPRSQLLPLPGYGPWLRVGMVGLLAGLVMLASRHRRKAQPGNSPAQPDVGKRKARPETRSEAAAAVVSPNEAAPEKFIATFLAALVMAGWLAQPVQLLLLGKGCQIYHYLVFTLPALYAYSVVILLGHFVKLAVPAEWRESGQRFGRQPSWPGAVLLGLVMLLAVIVSVENKITTTFSNGNARNESNVPWAVSGDKYRPAFRALEKEFRDNPALAQTRSFATLCHEVNFLLAGFYDKRAYLPDNGYSTLGDEELEGRLGETLKIFQLPPEHFLSCVQVTFMLNYWLGCAKYWMSSDHQYAPLDDYPAAERAALQQQAKQSPWSLCLPNSEAKRLTQKYQRILARESDRATHPDAVIMGLEKQFGLLPRPEWYREVYTNEMFSVYVKIPVGAASELPGNAVN